MKSFKLIALSAAVAIGGFIAITYSSCGKKDSTPANPCKDIVCQNGGTCDSATATCMCSTGYEGAHCETISRTKFVKSWTASDLVAGSSTPIPYTATIVAGTTSDVTLVSIGNFSDFFVNATIATINGSTITIATQKPDGGKYSVSGTGTLANSKITWTYTIDSAGVTHQNYTGTWQ